MVFAPTFNKIGADAWPEVTATVFTVTVAVLSAMVGVTEMVPVAFGTLSARVVGTVCPCEKPASVVNENKVLFGDLASFTTTVYVLVLVVFCAVTTMVIVLLPTVNGTDVATPDEAVAPLIVNVAFGSVVVGVIENGIPLAT